MLIMGVARILHWRGPDYARKSWRSFLLISWAMPMILINDRGIIAENIFQGAAKRAPLYLHHSANTALHLGALWCKHWGAPL
jgi:hypothetical protein